MSGRARHTYTHALTHTRTHTLKEKWQLSTRKENFGVGSKMLSTHSHKLWFVFIVRKYQRNYTNFLIIISLFPFLLSTALRNHNLYLQSRFFLDYFKVVPRDGHKWSVFLTLRGSGATVLKQTRCRSSQNKERKNGRRGGPTTLTRHSLSRNSRSPKYALIASPR